jgi:hypothetical protein
LSVVGLGFEYESVKENPLPSRMQAFIVADAREKTQKRKNAKQKLSWRIDRVVASYRRARAGVGIRMELEFAGAGLSRSWSRSSCSQQ